MIKNRTKTFADVPKVLLDFSIKICELLALKRIVDELLETLWFVLKARALEIFVIYIGAILALSALDLVENVTQMLIRDLLPNGRHYYTTRLFDSRDLSSY